MTDTIDTDVAIVGAGIAGLFAACFLPAGTRIAVIDKGTLGEGSSPLAQGGLAAAVGPGDSAELHLEDTIRAGAGLVDPAAAEVLCREAPDRVRDLGALGCRFDRNPGGSLHLAREGGQSVARSVHTADASGAEIVRALRVAARSRVERIEAYAFELAIVDATCVGVWALGAAGVALVRARAVLLASGGAGALFASTTNPPAATGDALALVHDASARLSDLEFVQFHPTALAVAESPRPLLTEALRGAGAFLVDSHGRRFMASIHPDAELAPRHVVTRAILDVGEAYLDARPLGAKELESHFPTVMASCRARGFDPVTQLLPVAPAAHYLIGGVATDLDARTSIPGLYGAGECAATGVHGANRLAGNSLAEAVVFGRRAAAAIAAQSPAQARDPVELPAEVRALELIKSPENVQVARDRRRRIIEAVTLGAGPIRTAETAEKALSLLERLGNEDVHSGPGRWGMENLAMWRAGHLLVRAALGREESRGVHLRADFPELDPALDGVHVQL